MNLTYSKLHSSTGYVSHRAASSQGTGPTGPDPSTTITELGDHWLPGSVRMSLLSIGQNGRNFFFAPTVLTSERDAFEQHSINAIRAADFPPEQIWMANPSIAQVVAEITGAPSRTVGAVISNRPLSIEAARIVRPTLSEQKSLKALALLDRWLSEQGDADAEELSLKELMTELNSDRRGRRQLFEAK